MAHYGSGTAVATQSCSCHTGQSHPGGHRNCSEELKGHVPRVLPVHIQNSQLSADTMPVFGAGGSWKAAGCQGCYGSTPCPQCVSLPHDLALREGLQVSMSCSGRSQPGDGSLTRQLPSSHPSLENLTIFQGSTAFWKNLIHIAAVQERVALLSYLISKGCQVLDTEGNPLLSLWTCGSQKAAIADLWISININHLQWNLA